jgi:LmbE family N-acetylglucosaminyl deacetylase
MKKMCLQPEGWKNVQRILVILAHPDDPEYFCGASLARWISAGHSVEYCLFTRGERGGNEEIISPKVISTYREKEQKSAAKVLGVKSVSFLDFEDGYLEPSLDARKQVVRAIRYSKPDIVVTCDPTNIFHRENYLNHPDHLAAGKIVLEAVFPAAGNPLFFPELINDEGLDAHEIKELWISLTNQPDIVLDVTDFWDAKINALHEHRSQIGELKAFDQRMRSRRTLDSTDEHPRYEEKFRRILFR